MVKLDRRFLEDVEGEIQRRRLCRGGGIALAHAAGKPVVFEGIETQTHTTSRQRPAPMSVQGFFFAPPLSAPAAEAMTAQYGQLEERRGSETAPGEGLIRTGVSFDQWPLVCRGQMAGSVLHQVGGRL